MNVLCICGHWFAAHAPYDDGERTRPYCQGCEDYCIQVEDRPETERLTTLVYTTAPAAYDGFGSSTVRNCLHTPYDGAVPYTVRQVRVRREHAHWQTLRYQSGGYIVVQP